MHGGPFFCGLPLTVFSPWREFLPCAEKALNLGRKNLHFPGIFCYTVSGGDFVESIDVFRRIDQLRREKGMSVYRLCRLAGVSYQNYCKWRASCDRWPLVPTLQAFCQVLEVNMGQLFAEPAADDPTAEEKILLEHWIFLSPRQKHLILQMMMAFLGEHT